MMNGEIWWCDFGIPRGSECGYRRPAVVVQNNELNKARINTTVVVPLTSNLEIAEYFPNIYVEKEYSGLKKDSVAVVHLITALDNNSFLERASELKYEKMSELKESIEMMVEN